MRTHKFLPLLPFAAALSTLALFSTISFAQVSPGTPAKLVVTAEGRHNKPVPNISKNDVVVNEKKEREQILDWVPAAGDHAALQLYVLIDDSLSTDVGLQLQDVRKFIDLQPPSTSVAIGYMRNGTVVNAQPFTNDHAQAEKAIRPPSGFLSGSAYFSVVDLMKHWQPFDGRREILMVTNGVEPYFETPTTENPYVEDAVKTLQMHNVVAFAIYAGGAGHFGHSFWRISWAQTYLSELTDRTGGESYITGFTSPVSFQPYLQDVTEKLNHQYILTFSASGLSRDGTPVKVSTEVPDVQLLAADRAFPPQ